MFINRDSALLMASIEQHFRDRDHRTLKMNLAYVAMVFVLCGTLVWSAKPKKPPLNYSKFTQVQCSSSGKTCPNMTCRIRPQRYLSAMDLGCDLLKPIHKLFISIEYSKKNGPANYWPVIDLKNIDVCAVLDNLDKYKFLVAEVAWFNRNFPGAARKCPYTEIKCEDASLYRNDSEPIGSGVPLLNGEYRMTMRLSNDDDENIATLIYHQLNKFHFTFGLYE